MTLHPVFKILRSYAGQLSERELGNAASACCHLGVHFVLCLRANYIVSAAAIPARKHRMMNGGRSESTHLSGVRNAVTER